MRFVDEARDWGRAFGVLDEVKAEWAWGEEGITILAVLEAREGLQTRAVEGCEGLADSTDGGLVECRSHHEGLIDGFKCNDRTNKFDGQETVCMCVIAVSCRQQTIRVYQSTTTTQR